MPAKVAVRVHGGEQNVWYYCPGCKHLHGVPSERWHWNGNLESPSLSPSVRHYIPEHDGIPEKTICHYHVRNGMIEYCGDCVHDLSGKSVDMVEPGSHVPDDS